MANHARTNISLREKRKHKELVTDELVFVKEKKSMKQAKVVSVIKGAKKVVKVLYLHKSGKNGPIMKLPADICLVMHA